MIRNIIRMNNDTQENINLLADLMGVGPAYLSKKFSTEKARMIQSLEMRMKKMQNELHRLKGGADFVAQIVDAYHNGFDGKISTVGAVKKIQDIYPHLGLSEAKSLFENEVRHKL